MHAYSQCLRKRKSIIFVVALGLLTHARRLSYTPGGFHGENYALEL